MLNSLLALCLLLGPVQNDSGPADVEPPRDSRSIESLLQVGDSLELPAWGQLTHGTHAVGFERRSGLSIWYPGEVGQPMRLADYTDAAGFQSLGVDVAPLLQRPMYAARDVKPVAGSFPLVVAPGGYPNAGMFAEMAEFLASHGLVVVYFPVAEESVPAALGYATRMLTSIAHESADVERIALWGYQRAGMTATLLQAAAAARVVVSIEGSEAWRHPEYGFPAGQRWLKKLASRAPVIRFQSSRERPRWHFSSPVNTTLAYYADYPAPVRMVELEGVSHDQLSAFAVWSRLLPGLMKPSAGALAAHRRIGEQALAFLAVHLPMQG